MRSIKLGHFDWNFESLRKKNSFKQTHPKQRLIWVEQKARYLEEREGEKENKDKINLESDKILCIEACLFYFLFYYLKSVAKVFYGEGDVFVFLYLSISLTIIYNTEFKANVKWFECTSYGLLIIFLSLRPQENL